MAEYRDEKENLRRRVAELERELAEVHARVARDEEKDALRARVAELEALVDAEGRGHLLEELDALHDELDRLRARRRTGLAGPNAYLYVLVPLVLVGVGIMLARWPGAGFWLLLALLVVGTFMLATRFSSKSERARWLRIADDASRAPRRPIAKGASKERRTPEVRVEVDAELAKEEEARRERRAGASSKKRARRRAR